MWLRTTLCRSLADLLVPAEVATPPTSDCVPPRHLQLASRLRRQLGGDGVETDLRGHVARDT